MASAACMTAYAFMSVDAELQHIWTPRSDMDLRVVLGGYT